MPDDHNPLAVYDDRLLNPNSRIDVATLAIALSVSLRGLFLYGFGRSAGHCSTRIAVLWMSEIVFLIGIAGSARVVHECTRKGIR
jgi:hypothetical protein